MNKDTHVYVCIRICICVCIRICIRIRMYKDMYKDTHTNSDLCSCMFVKKTTLNWISPGVVW